MNQLTWNIIRRSTFPSMNFFDSEIPALTCWNISERNSRRQIVIVNWATNCRVTIDIFSGIESPPWECLQKHQIVGGFIYNFLLPCCYCSSQDWEGLPLSHTAAAVATYNQIIMWDKATRNFKCKSSNICSRAAEINQKSKNCQESLYSTATISIARHYL